MIELKVLPSKIAPTNVENFQGDAILGKCSTQGVIQINALPHGNTSMDFGFPVIVL